MGVSDSKEGGKKETPGQPEVSVQSKRKGTEKMHSITETGFTVLIHNDSTVCCFLMLSSAPEDTGKHIHEYLARQNETFKILRKNRMKQPRQSTAQARGALSQTHDKPYAQELLAKRKQACCWSAAFTVHKNNMTRAYSFRVRNRFLTRVLFTVSIISKPYTSTTNTQKKI